MASGGLSIDENVALNDEYEENKRQQIEIEREYINELGNSWQKTKDIISSLKRQSKKYDKIPTYDVHQTRILVDGIFEQESRDIGITGKISEVLKELLLELQEKLSKVPGLAGRFHPIGSTPSGTGLSKSTDFDYIYELTSKAIRVELIDKSYKCTVYSLGEELKPLETYEAFAKTLNSLLLDIKLPGRLRFGGFAKPNYSGIRLCEPAVTTLLQWKDDTVDDFYDIPVDITVGFRIPTENKKIVKQVRDTLHDRFGKKLDIGIEEIKSGIHLVPVNPEDGKWYMSTAVFETRLLQQLTSDHPAKSAIQTCKQVNQFLVEAINTYLKPSIDEEISEFKDWLNASLNFHKDLVNSENSEASELEAILREILPIAHILLSKENGETFGETCTKNPLAVNSSAIKYQTFNLLNGNTNLHTAETLQRLVLETFSAGDGLIDHTFLGSHGCYKIHQFTVACYCTKQRIKLYCTAQAILREISAKINASIRQSSD